MRVRSPAHRCHHPEAGSGEAALGPVEPPTPQAAEAKRWLVESGVWARAWGAERNPYPAEALEGFAPHMPDGWQDDMALISQPMDFLGVNYYTREMITTDDSSVWPRASATAGPGDKTQMGWEIYPDGLRHVLVRMARDFVGDMPIFVTENGMAWDDHVENGAVYDPVRMKFVSDHFLAAKQAIAEGAKAAESVPRMSEAVPDMPAAHQRLHQTG